MAVAGHFVAAQILLILLCAMPTTLVFADESRGASGSLAGSDRSGRASVGVDVFGWSPYPMISRGFRAGYGVDPLFDIELNHQYADKKILMAGLSYTETVLRIVHRPADLFYWGYGLGQRDIRLSYELFVSGQAERQAVKEHHTALTGVGFAGLEVMVLGGFSCGADLLGVSAPLVWSKKDDRFPDDAVSYEEDPRDYPYVEKAFSMNFQILQTYVRLIF